MREVEQINAGAASPQPELSAPVTAAPRASRVPHTCERCLWWDRKGAAVRGRCIEPHRYDHRIYTPADDTCQLWRKGSMRTEADHEREIRELLAGVGCFVAEKDNSRASTRTKVDITGCLPGGRAFFVECKSRDAARRVGRMGNRFARQKSALAEAAARGAATGVLLDLEQAREWLRECGVTA